MKKYIGLSCSLLFFLSLNTYAQSRSGRGYDWWDDGSSVEGEGGAWIIFLIIFWTGVFLMQIFYQLYEDFNTKHKDWQRKVYSFLARALKIILFATLSIGVFMLFYYSIDAFDFRFPRYMDYLGNFFVCILWLVIIRYLFFNNVSSDKIKDFFKTKKGIFIGMLIAMTIFVLTFS